MAENREEIATALANFYSREYGGVFRCKFDAKRRMYLVKWPDGKEAGVVPKTARKLIKGGK